MKRPGAPDDFERMLGSALDPGEIGFSEDERAELLATTEFMALLARELDPGEIEFEPGQRQELQARLSAVARDEDLTAWALEELPAERRLPLEARMDDDVALRTEGLAIRNFCHRAVVLLPPLPAPGWWERRRIRRVFSLPTPRRRQAGFGAAAAAAVALLVFSFQRPGDRVIPTPSAELALPVKVGVAGVAGVAEVAEVAPALAPEVPSASPVWKFEQAGVLPETRAGGDSERIQIVGAFPDSSPEQAFTFSEVPPWPEMKPTGGSGEEFDRLLGRDLKIREDAPPIVLKSMSGDQEWAGGFFRGLDAVGPFHSPRLTGGSRDLVTAAAISRVDQVEPDPDDATGQDPGNTDALAPGVPEAGSLILAQSQPYLLSALLRGPVSGRPDLSRAETGLWMSADFQAMDFNLPSGRDGVESDTWRIEAGMSWLLSPSWQAGVSLEGIDSRIDVPGFGTVDAEGVALSWSLDWRQDGYHAALTHTLGSFDQDLRRMSGGMMQPSGQDATMQQLSLWFTREFEAGQWTHGPVVGVEGSWGSLEGYQEPFAGGVSMAGRDFGLMTTLVGWQVSGRFETAAGDWVPHAVLGWRHRPILEDNGMVQGGPTGNFVVPPVAPGRDSLLLEGGLRWLPPGGLLFFDAVSSAEWRDGGDAENSLLFKLGFQF